LAAAQTTLEELTEEMQCSPDPCGSCGYGGKALGNEMVMGKSMEREEEEKGRGEK